jgi:hypothetical protein
MYYDVVYSEPKYVDKKEFPDNVVKAKNGAH